VRAVIRVLVSFLGLAGLAVTTAWAQHPQTREGFWIGFGFGYGTAGLTCDACGSTTREGPQTREGFWIGFGFGYGTAGLTCDACGSTTREGSASGYVKLGGTLNKSVLLGGEVDAWTKGESGVTVTLGNVSAAAYLYPAPQTGFFFKGGVGYANLRVSNSGTATANGFGFVVGAGYDIRVGRNISLTPVANFYWGGDGDLKESGTTIDTGYKHNVFDFGLGITFH